MIDAVLQKLAQSQFVLLHGTSGCGKSSLVKAGLLPRLEATHYGEGKTWQTAQMRPGGSPLWNLAEAIARLVAGLGDDEEPPLDIVRPIRRRLNRGENAFAAIQEQFNLGLDGNVCLLIDQFEELFRYATQIERSEVEMFIRVLQAFDENPPNGIHLIATMRSDFVGDCAQFIGFAEVVNRTQYLLPRLEERELMDSIRRPAELFGGEIEVPLAVKLVEESRAEVDALPLVQHCLMYLWNKADAASAGPEDKAARTIGLETFLGLKETLSERADEILIELLAEHQDAERCTEHLFRAIIELDGEGRATRRPMRLSELHQICPGDQETLDHCIKRFADPDIGFIVISRDEDPIVDITHESLIRCWDRLSVVDKLGPDGRPEGWLQREREDARTWRSLSSLAEDSHSLVTPTVLSDRERFFQKLPGAAWADRYGGHWKDVQDLLARSRQAVDSQEEQARRDWEFRERVFYGAIASVAVCLILAVTAYRYSEQSQSNLNRFQETATQYLVEDWAIARSQALRNLAPGSESSDVRWQIGLYFLDNAPFDLERDAELPAGLAREFEALKRDFRISFEAKTAFFEYRFADDEVDGVAVSRDGQWLAAGADDGQIGLWDLSAEGGPAFKQSSEMKSAHATLDEKYQVGQVRFNPVGTELLSVGYDGKAIIWDTETLKPIRTFQNVGRYWGADWSEDGVWIAAGADRGTARVWNWAEPDPQPIEFKSGSELAMGVAFNRDATEIAVAPVQANIQIHSIEAPDRDFRPVGQGEFFSVEWSDNGAYIASGLDDGIVIVWTEDGEEVVRMSNREAARALAFSPDNRFLATGSDSGEARVWAIPSGELVADLKGHRFDVDSIAWTPDGKHIVTGTDGGMLRMFEFDDIGRSNGSLQSIINAAKQRLLADQSLCIGEAEWAAALPDDALPEWCLSKQDRIDNLISEIAESGDDEWLEFAEQLLAAAQPIEIFEALESAISNLQISPNSPAPSKLLARRYIDVAGLIEGAESGELAARLALLRFQIEKGPNDAGDVKSLITLEALSRSSLPNGAQLAANASAVQVFAQAEQRFILPDDRSRVRSIDFDAVTQTLAVAMDSGRVQLWDYAKGEPIATAGSGLGATAYDAAFDPKGGRLAIAFQDERYAIWPLSEDMWTLQTNVKIPRGVSWSAGGQYLATGGDDTIARVWNMENGTAPPSAVELRGHSGGVRDLDLSASGTRLLTGSNDATARLWNAQTAEVLNTFPRDAAVDAVDYAPDDRLLAIGGADDLVELRDAENGELLNILRFASNVHDVAFSDDGRWLAVASTKASVWNIETGVRRFTLDDDAANGNIVAVAWEGDKLLTGSQKGVTTRWAFSPETLEQTLQKSVTRCLTANERKRFGLPAAPPDWCADLSAG